MHEHGLADEVLKALLSHRDRTGVKSVVAATVQVSELAGLSAPALQMALDHVCEHYGLACVDLTVEVPGVIAQCARCGETAAMADDLCCTECGSNQVRLCGDETMLVTSCTCA